MMLKISKNLLLIFLFSLFAVSPLARAQVVDTDSKNFPIRIEVFLLPRSGSFVEGSTFEVPILVNTKGASINGVNIKINFNKDKLSIVQPSGGKSIIGFWEKP